MFANRADVRSFRSVVNMPAVCANPSDRLLFLKYLVLDNVAAQFQITLLVALFYLSDLFKEECDLIEALFFCLFGECSVLIGPLVDFAVGSILQV